MAGKGAVTLRALGSTWGATNFEGVNIEGGNNNIPFRAHTKTWPRNLARVVVPKLLRFRQVLRRVAINTMDLFKGWAFQIRVYIYCGILTQ